MTATKDSHAVDLRGTGKLTVGVCDPELAAAIEYIHLLIEHSPTRLEAGLRIARLLVKTKPDDPLRAGASVVLTLPQYDMVALAARLEYQLAEHRLEADRRIRQAGSDVRGHPSVPRLIAENRAWLKLRADRGYPPPKLPPATYLDEGPPL